MKNYKLIFGIHALLEALESQAELDKILIRRGLRSEDVTQIIEGAKRRGIPVQQVPEEKLNRLTHGNHQGVVAFLAHIEYTDLEQLLPLIYEEGRMPFIMVLDGLTDVRNFGAIARTAECAGVDAIVIPDRGSVTVTGDAIKTSSGALLRIPVCRVPSIAQTLRYLQASGLHVAVASEKAELTYYNAKLTPPLAIVMGSEEVGPSPETIRLADELVRIPQQGSIGSLNVSVAAGILMYEVLRHQRTDI